MNKEIKTRLKWVILYETIGQAGIVYHRCGISRPTLRKWRHRYQELGLDGLKSKSRRPHSSPKKKISAIETDQILLLRTERNLGVPRIQNELKRQYGLSLSLSTIQKVLNENNVLPLRRPKRERRIRRYSRKIPGGRVQMDTCKIAPRLYQYTAVDDCTRYL